MMVQTVAVVRTVGCRANTDGINNSSDVGCEDIDVSRLTFVGLIRQCGEHWHLRWWLLVRREEVVLMRAVSRDVEKVVNVWDQSFEISGLYITNLDIVVSVNREKVKVDLLGHQCLGVGSGEAPTWTLEWTWATRTWLFSPSACNRSQREFTPKYSLAPFLA